MFPPSLTPADRANLMAQGLIVSEPKSGATRALHDDWVAALGRARAAFEALRNIEQRYSATYRRENHRALPRKKVGNAYKIPKESAA